MPKAAIVLLADTESSGDLGRAVNALVTAKEFQDAGDDVSLVFDGAATTWIAELSNTGHEYSGLFEEVRDRIDGACSYCAKAYGVGEEVKACGVEMLGEYEGHPSLRRYVQQGYEVITF
jgi:hypothetical protein